MNRLQYFTRAQGSAAWGKRVLACPGICPIYAVFDLLEKLAFLLCTNLY
jgi:hypothetical protein